MQKPLRHGDSLAMLCTRQGEYEDAKDLFTTGLRGRQDISGRDHPQTLEIISGFGVLRREQRRYEEAEKPLKEALKGRQIKFGADYLATLESKNALARLYKEQELYDKTEPLLWGTIKGRRAASKAGTNRGYEEVA